MDAMPTISRMVWEAKYRRVRADGELEASEMESWRRVATALAAAEPTARTFWQRRFLGLLESLAFLPGGRILAGAGTDDEVTLFNCFVLPPPRDDSGRFTETMLDAAKTMRQGGGIGFDCSELPPSGSEAPGPVVRLHELNDMCEHQLAGGVRRGAMMATLRCDHPAIGEFVMAKRKPDVLNNFNLSVLISDAFMSAVRHEAGWDLRFPATGESCEKVDAAALYDQIARAAFATAEPGVLFIDRINAWNNLWYCEQITATNPCGEVPLPSYGACDLGSVNLTRFVRNAFTPRAHIDEVAIETTVPIAVRLLDNVIDVSRFPLAEQRATAARTRRIGLGITGLGSALLMLGLQYDSAAARGLAGRVMKRICHAAYRTSNSLAEEKGSFPAFDRDRYLASPFIAALPSSIRDGIARHGIRNSHLLAIAPTGSISLLAGGVSSGIEPIVGPRIERRITLAGGRHQVVELTDFAVAMWQARRAKGDGVPPAFMAAVDVSADRQLKMQAVLQRHVDNAISKTVTVSAEEPFERFRTLYDKAYDLGLKGCTAFRQGSLREAVMTAGKACDVHCPT